MDTKKFLTGTIVGGITYFILGFVFYAVLFDGYFETHGNYGSLERTDHLIWWALILGNLAGAAMLTYIFLNWANIITFKSGLKAGIIIGLLLALSFDLIMFATTRLLDWRGIVVDIAIGTVMTAIAGGVIGAVLHTKSEAGHAEA
jgi:hypothetical protein